VLVEPAKEKFYFKIVGNQEENLVRKYSQMRQKLQNSSDSCYMMQNLAKQIAVVSS